MIRILGPGVLGGLMCLGAGLLSSDDASAVVSQAVSAVDLTGRWDLTTLDTEGFSSAWLELTSDRMQGRLVWLYGGVEPIHDVVIEDRTMTFHHSVAGEQLTFTARLSDDRLEGIARGARSQVQWIGVRAPDLHSLERPHWEHPRPLMNGRDLSGWVPRSAEPLPMLAG